MFIFWCLWGETRYVVLYDHYPWQVASWLLSPIVRLSTLTPLYPQTYPCLDISLSYLLLESLTGFKTVSSHTQFIRWTAFLCPSSLSPSHFPASPRNASPLFLPSCKLTVLPHPPAASPPSKSASSPQLVSNFIVFLWMYSSLPPEFLSTCLQCCWAFSSHLFLQSIVGM